MLKNYLLIAIRSFKKDRVNAAISVFGLVIGLACTMLIIGYIRYEFSFESNYSNSDRIYRVVAETNHGVFSEKTDVIPEAVGPTIVRDIPGVEAQTSLRSGSFDCTNKQEIITINVTFVDSSFFSVFNLRFIAGNPATALNHSGNIVLTRSKSKEIFGTYESIGKIFTTNSNSYIITGIIENLPQNTSLRTDAFVLDFKKEQLLTNITNSYGSSNSFLLLNSKNSLRNTEIEIKKLCVRYRLDGYNFTLQPLKNMHLGSSEIKHGGSLQFGDSKYVYIYACVALLILTIGCLNFINLSIARSIERMKEVGMRKVMGARKKQLIFQFIGESALYFAIAFPIALLLAYFFWESFSSLLGNSMDVSFLLNVKTILAIISVCIASSMVSSIYPAFFLSKIKPAITLKGSGNRDLKINLGLRKALLITQFSISIILIIVTAMVHMQLLFLHNQPLGFNKSNLFSFKIPFKATNKQAFKNRIEQNPEIQSVTFSGLEIADSYGATAGMEMPGDSTKRLDFAFVEADTNFFKTFEVPIVRGRTFSSRFPADLQDYGALADSAGKKDEVNRKNNQPADAEKEVVSDKPVIVSEKLVTSLGIKDPIDKKFYTAAFQGRIIGTISDFKGMSLKGKSPLIVIRYSFSGHGDMAYVKINSANSAATTNYINKVFRQFYPKEKFDFSFVEDRIAHLYDFENRLTKLFKIFSFLAIILSCMGLFSIVSLVMRKRVKEIGIRKVLGASVRDIIIMVNKEFISLLVLAAVIAAPIGYWAVHEWLKGYATRIEISQWVFVSAGAAALFIALITVTLQSLRVAVANPVKSLRTE